MMKKIVLALIVVSSLISLPVFAAEMQDQDAPPGMPEKHMEKMKGKGMCDLPMMGKSSMVATDEGGVIVLLGNKLMRYDADLNLEKEVEIKTPDMGKQCPMMGMAGKGEASDSKIEKKMA